MSLGWALLASALVALLDESIQELVPGRAFELSDLGWDFLAASLGAMLLTLFLALLPGKLRAVFIT
jgi:VanZ family protein